MQKNTLNNHSFQKAVIFDMDGVIAHTNPYHAKAFQVFFDRHKISYSEQEFEDHMYGKHNSHIFTYFFGRKIYGQELLSFEDEKEGLFREIYASLAEPIPYLVEFLTDLEHSDFKLGVATAAPRANLDLVIDTLQIRHFFQSLLASEDVNLHKPHPEVYLKSAENLQLPAESCVVFEDSVSGVTAGLNAGMQVVGVLSSHSEDVLPKCALYINDYKNISAVQVMNLLSSYVG